MLEENLTEAGHSIPNNFGIEHFRKEDVTQIIEECGDFRELVSESLTRAKSIVPTYDDTQAGIDFWMTRNGHGCGYWDRGLGQVGTELTKWAKSYGSMYLYINDDGEVVIY